MTAATATTPTVPAWATRAAEALGGELGRFVSVLAYDVIALGWFLGRVLVALDLILGWGARLALALGWALVSAVIYALEDRTGRRQMRRRFHRRHTVTTKPRHYIKTTTRKAATR